ncbi:MAG: acetate--CoA ligase [Thermoleophilaceae bacterium]|nr:acetate--CoA ligase [Thermoleophilaceae bacterium]
MTSTFAWPAIPKAPRPGGAEPNMPDYERECETFTWEQAERELDGLPGRAGLNIAHEAVTRHVRAGHGGDCALRWLPRAGAPEELTYEELERRSNRFANVLERLGVARGERVFCFTGRIPALYAAALGTLKHGCVFSPLFSAFGPEPARQRLEIGDARVLVTTPALYERKIAQLRGSLPDLRHVLLAGAGEGGAAGTESLERLLGEASDDYEIPATDPEEPALLHFTSGTTGMPKGAVHVHQAVVAHHATGRLALDLHAGDVFWCTADPGWVTGTSYGILSPLTNRVTSVVDAAEFDAERWYSTLEEQQVNVWYTAPTAVRMLMRAGAELASGFDLGRLRFIASVGEPLNPEAVVWAEDALGLPIHDNWWQTETGGIMISNYACMEIRPGSMGKPLPGVRAGILARDDDGDLLLRDGEPEEVGPGVEGELALRPGWPSMFRAYLGEEERYRRCFAGGWYRTGDLARRDEDGYFWFVGRGDDVIKSAGHLIGPFEVESVLMVHPDVVEAGVIGKPDPVAGSRIKAFVVLREGAEPDNALRREILALARTRLGPAVAPKEIEFVADLPRTRSGKIMRRLLKARELELPEGDTSTLETA